MPRTCRRFHAQDTGPAGNLLPQSLDLWLPVLALGSVAFIHDRHPGAGAVARLVAELRNPGGQWKAVAVRYHGVVLRQQKRVRDVRVEYLPVGFM